MSRLWLIRLGKYGEAEARVRQDRTLATGWEIDQDITEAKPHLRRAWSIVADQGVEG